MRAQPIYGLWKISLSNLVSAMTSIVHFHRTCTSTTKLLTLFRKWKREKKVNQIFGMKVFFTYTMQWFFRHSGDPPHPVWEYESRSHYLSSGTRRQRRKLNLKWWSPRIHSWQHVHNRTRVVHQVWLFACFRTAKKQKYK